MNMKPRSISLQYVVRMVFFKNWHFILEYIFGFMPTCTRFIWLTSAPLTTWHSWVMYVELTFVNTLLSEKQKYCSHLGRNNSKIKQAENHWIIQAMLRLQTRRDACFSTNSMGGEKKKIYTHFCSHFDAKTKRQVFISAIWKLWLHYEIEKSELELKNPTT